MMSQDYIIENSITRDQPPICYQLKLNVSNLDGDKEEVSKLRRCTLGKKDPSKSNRTILLVGETGSGKSTLINTILNYAMGVKNGDNKWYEIVDDSKRDSRSGSVTSKVSVYEIFGFEDESLPYSLTIIDTPGYGDTKALEHDAVITQKLHDLFRSQDGVHELHAVGLVMKASENRLSDRLMYVFNSVLSLFGKDLEEKIVALITHSDGMPPTNALKALEDANIKCAKNTKNQPVSFVFNNCLSTEITDETEFALGQAWALTTRGLSQFTAFLEKTTPQELETTVTVLNERIRFAACINNLMDRIELLQLKQTEIKQTQEGLEKNKEKLKTGEDFTIEVDEPYKEEEKIGGGMWLFWYGGAVCCKECKETCHYPGCTLAWKPAHCEVMKKGHCTVCTGKCPPSKHVKEQWRYVNKTQKVQKTIEQVKKKYEADQEHCENLLSKLEIEKENLQKEKNTCLDESYQHVVNLEKTALNDSVFTFVHLDFLIEQMKEKGDTEKVQKLEKMTSRVDEGILGGLRYRFGKVGGNVKKLLKGSNS